MTIHAIAPTIEHYIVHAIEHTIKDPNEHIIAYTLEYTNAMLLHCYNFLLVHCTIDSAMKLHSFKQQPGDKTQPVRYPVLGAQINRNLCVYVYYCVFCCWIHGGGQSQGGLAI